MDDVEECTGLAAQWCPNCGTCNCPHDDSGERTRDRATCPLHGDESRHAQTLCAGNCGEIVSEEGERCDACEVKHLRAQLDAARADQADPFVRGWQAAREAAAAFHEERAAVTVVVTAHVEVTARDEDEALALALDLPADAWRIDVAPSELSADGEPPPEEELDVEDMGPAGDET